MHGHIDRIAKGEVGTLLDRFQNRFGSELDKEIIVLRKKQQQDMRSIKPIVELISVPEKDDSINMSEFMESMKDNDFLSKVSEVTNISEEQLSELSNAELKKFFKSADKDKSGTVDFNEFVSEILELDSSKDEFVDFFNIVNDLLGDAPDEFINTFLASDDFKLFEEIGKEPNSASTEDRNNFFLMINRVLGDLPTDTINNFVNSPDFEIFSRMGELYGE
jgi:Ca2+-binding EF-hand superfamily protein